MKRIVIALIQALLMLGIIAVTFIPSALIANYSPLLGIAYSMLVAAWILCYILGGTK